MSGSSSNITRNIYFVDRLFPSGLLANNSFGEISKFSSAREFAMTLRKHNDPQDPYHLTMFEHLVIGADVQAARMLVTSDPWSLLHALRAIVARWTFQVNMMDVTFGVCRHAVDLLSMGINSMPHSNHQACYCSIPSKCESEKFIRVALSRCSRRYSPSGKRGIVARRIARSEQTCVL